MTCSRGAAGFTAGIPKPLGVSEPGAKGTFGACGSSRSSGKAGGLAKTLSGSKVAPCFLLQRTPAIFKILAQVQASVSTKRWTSRAPALPSDAPAKLPCIIKPSQTPRRQRGFTLLCKEASETFA